MAKRIVDDSSLTTVANAIRRKGGTSDALTFPNGFTSAIAAIQTGGSSDGNSGPFSVAEEFIWTATSKYTAASGYVTISHSLGVVPDGYYLMALETEFGNNTECIVNNVIYDNSMMYAAAYPMAFMFGLGANFNTSALAISIDTGDICTSTDVKFFINDQIGTQVVPAGKQYRVLVYKR